MSVIYESLHFGLSYQLFWVTWSFFGINQESRTGRDNLLIVLNFGLWNTFICPESPHLRVSKTTKRNTNQNSGNDHILATNCMHFLRISRGSYADNIDFFHKVPVKYLHKNLWMNPKNYELCKLNCKKQVELEASQK